MKLFRFKKAQVLNVAGVFLFALLFVSIPYSSLRGGVEFTDLLNYEKLFSSNSFSVKVFKGDGGGVKDYLFNEVLWGGVINFLIDFFGLKVVDALKVISFFTIFLMGLYVRRGAGWWWLLLLLNPLLVDAVMSQIRIAFAISLFYGVFLTRKRWLIWVMNILSFSIHTSMAPILSSFWACWLAFRVKFVRESKWIGLAIVVAAGVFFAFLLGPLSHFIVEIAAEDRRAQAGHFEAALSLKYATPWLLMYTAYVLQGNRFCSVPNNTILIYLLSVFTAAVFLEVYSTRFLAIAIPAMICGVKMLNIKWKKPVLGGFVAMTMMQWYYWLFVQYGV